MQYVVSSMKNSLFVRLIFERYYSEVLGYVAKKFYSRSDIEDIVQEAFCNILGAKNIEAIENPRAYLYQTAVNQALKRVRKDAYHQQYIEDQDLDDLTPTLDSLMLAKNRLEVIENILSELPNKYRKTFELSRVHSMSYREISEELNIPVSTVEKHIIRVLKHLRDHQSNLHEA